MKWVILSAFALLSGRIVTTTSMNSHYHSLFSLPGDLISRLPLLPGRIVTTGSMNYHYQSLLFSLLGDLVSRLPSAPSNRCHRASVLRRGGCKLISQRVEAAIFGP